jgi:hypothetical protein
MITKINTNIPKQTNHRIVDLLYKVGTWSFGLDDALNKKLDTVNSGLTYGSFYAQPDRFYVNHESLNSYAVFIQDIIEQNSYMKFKKLHRIYWNWYCPGAIMGMHQDELTDNYYSIIYNLHTNDGGTEFKVNDEIKFYKSVESEALLFPSKLYHRGVAPKKDPNRFNLNILLEI